TPATPPEAGSVATMTLAADSACLNFSAELMSGIGLSLRTPMPMELCEISVIVPATTLPSAATWSRTILGNTATSAISPPWMRFRRSPASAKLTDTCCPATCPRRAWRSLTISLMPLAQTILTSAAAGAAGTKAAASIKVNAMSGWVLMGSPGLWKRASASFRQRAALVERREAAGRRRHQEGVALAQDSLDVGRVDVRVADRHLALLAGVDDVLHRVEHLRMLVLAREAELLAQVAFADQD